MAHDVFISHSTKDKEIANAVCAGLEQRGIRCWIAPRNILPGENWTEAISTAVLACKAVVLVFSSAVLDSKYVEREIILAGECQKVIVPVKIEEVHPTNSYKLLLATRHWIDAVNAPLDSQMQQLARIIMNLVLHGMVPARDERVPVRPPKVHTAPVLVYSNTKLHRPHFTAQTWKVWIIAILSIGVANLEYHFHHGLRPGADGVVDGFLTCGAYTAASTFLMIMYCRWLGKVYANLEALGAVDLSTTPAGAVISFYIPLVALIRPYFVILEILIKSGAGASAGLVAFVSIWWLIRLCDYANCGWVWYQYIDSNFSMNLPILKQMSYTYSPDLFVSCMLAFVIDHRQNKQENLLKEQELLQNGPAYVGS